ncbi:DnaB-like helicase C-terminal domain-containing protein [Escherichia coli]
MVTEQVNSLRQEREAAVIGGLLLGGLTPNAQDVLATLDPEVFTIPLYKRAFEIIRAQARNRNLIDALMVGDEIGNENFIPLMQTARSCPSAANLKGYAALLQEEYQRRQMLELMDDIRYNLETGTLEAVRETMKYFDSRYSKLKTTKDKIIPVLLRDAVQEYTEVLSKRMECGVNSDNIKTGIDPLDEMLGGINATDLVLIAGRPGSGKALKNSEKILLASGEWTTHGEVKVGDVLASVDGKESIVTGVFPQGVRDIYEIEFEDGRKVDSADCHLWEINSTKWGESRVVDTVKLNDLLSKSRYQGRVRIPVFGGDCGSNNDIGVDPWLLGALIGDGCLSRSGIKISCGQDYVLDRVKALCCDFDVKQSSTNPYDYRIVAKGSKGRGGKNSLIDALRQLGVYGKHSWEKFIPDVIFSSNKSIRLGVLVGLLESDGWMEKKGSLHYASCSEQLTVDVIRLARSLGGCGHLKVKNNVTFTYKGEKRVGRDSFIATLKLPSWVLAEIKHPRLKSRLPENRLYKHGLQIKSVTFKGREECTCIMVSHDRHLYITSDYIVTHNTSLALKIAEKAAQRPYPGGEGQRVGVLLFTLEMSLDQMTERAIAGAGNLSTDCLRNPVKLDDEGWAHVAQGMSALADLDVWIVDASQLTVEEIRATVERMKQDHPNLGMVMIDYIGLMKLAKAERHDLAVGQLSWSLKMMAKELRVPVAALAQLSRRVEERPNKRPNNSDLRDSGNLEQDADRIIMVYRDGYYNEQSVAREYMEIIVSKNRHGKTGTVYQRFDDNGNILPCDQARAASACIQSMRQRPAASRFSPRNNQNNASF